MSVCTSVRLSVWPSERLSVCLYEHWELGNYTSYNTSHQYLSIDPKKFATPPNRPQTSKNRRYEHGYLANCQRQRNAISDLNSVALYAAQVCYTNRPRPLYRPQTDQICGAHNLHARYKILTKIYWSRQYLSTDSKSLPRPL